MAEATAEALTIRPFEKALHHRSGFSCGHEGIDNFLKQSLSQTQKDHYVRAYMATAGDAKAVAGFYTLQAHSVMPAHVPVTGKAPPTIPAIYIKAVAVDRSYQGGGVGTALMLHALRQCLAIAELSGAAVVVLDVLNDAQYESRRQFYADLGFQQMMDAENPERMYLRMKDIRATLGQ